MDGEAYLQSHNVRDMFERLQMLLVQQRPDNPEAFVAAQLRRDTGAAPFDVDDKKKGQHAKEEVQEEEEGPQYYVGQYPQYGKEYQERIMRMVAGRRAEKYAKLKKQTREQTERHLKRQEEMRQFVLQLTTALCAGDGRGVRALLRQRSYCPRPRPCDYWLWAAVCHKDKQLALPWAKLPQQLRRFLVLHNELRSMFWNLDVVLWQAAAVDDIEVIRELLRRGASLTMTQAHGPTEEAQQHDFLLWPEPGLRLTVRKGDSALARLFKREESELRQLALPVVYDPHTQAAHNKWLHVAVQHMSLSQLQATCHPNAFIFGSEPLSAEDRTVFWSLLLFVLAGEADVRHVMLDWVLQQGAHIDGVRLERRARGGIRGTGSEAVKRIAAVALQRGMAHRVLREPSKGKPQSKGDEYMQWHCPVAHAASQGLGDTVRYLLGRGASIAPFGVPDGDIPVPVREGWFFRDDYWATNTLAVMWPLAIMWHQDERKRRRRKKKRRGLVRSPWGREDSVARRTLRVVTRDMQREGLEQHTPLPDVVCEVIMLFVDHGVVSRVARVAKGKSPASTHSDSDSYSEDSQDVE